MELKLYVYSFKFYNNKCYALAESKIIGNPEYKLIGTTTLQIEPEKKEVVKSANAVRMSGLYVSVLDGENPTIPPEAYDIKVTYKIKE